MLKTCSISCHPSFLSITYQRTIRFILVGKSLHFIALIGLIVFLFSLNNIITFEGSFLNLIYLFWCYVSLFGLSLPVFAEMDAVGRYQDYKKIKDVIFKYGFDARLLRPFMNSKCQRDSILAASKDLKYLKKTRLLFYNEGYRWYHVLPGKFIKNPLIIFRNEFWYKILFANTYHLKYFYW